MSTSLPRHGFSSIKSYTKEDLCLTHLACLASLICMHRLWLCCSIVISKSNLSLLNVEVLMPRDKPQKIRLTVGYKSDSYWYSSWPSLSVSLLCASERKVSSRQPVASQVYWFPLSHVNILSSAAGFGILPESLESVHCGYRGKP